MGFRLIQPKRVKKKKSHNAQEVLDRLKAFLDENQEEPVRFLCGFWEDQQNAITYQELREAVKDGYISQQTMRDWQHDYSVLVKNQLVPFWQDAMKEGIHGQPVFDGKNFEFDTQTPGAMKWINERGAEFVTNSTDEQREAIAALLTEKMRNEHTVDELARMIRPCIGLTRGQAEANAKYYDNIVATLTEDHPRMSRDSIRKKALDASLKYAERQHRQRALTIATTESAFAYNRGADEGVRQATQAGLLGTCVKRWSTSGDDNVCPICQSLEGMEISMDEDFGFKGRELFTGQKMLPPAHPMCACAVEYIETEAPQMIPQQAQSPQPDVQEDHEALETMSGDKSYADDLSELLKNSPDNARKAFAHYRGSFEEHIEIPAGDAYFSPGDVRVRMNMAEVAVGASEYDAPYSTFFHEYGHNIDWLMGEEFGTAGHNISATYKNGILVKTMNREAENAVKIFYRANVNVYSPGVSAKDIIDAVVNSGDAALETKARNFRSAIRRGEKTIEDMLDEDDLFTAYFRDRMSVDYNRVVAKDFSQIIRNNFSKIERGDISDMFEERIGVDKPFGCGHDVAYFRQHDILTGKYKQDMDKLGTEAFAEMYSATVSNPQSLAQIKHFFPESYKIFEEILEMIV